MARRVRTPEEQVIYDITVRFQVYLERLKSGEMRKINAAIVRFDKEIVSALRSLGDAPSKAALNAMLTRLRERMLTLSDDQLKNYMGTLKDFSEYAVQFNTATLNVIAPPNAPAVEPDALAAWASTLEAPIQATGSLMEPFVKTWGQSATRQVEGAIRTGYAQGQTTEQIVRKVRGTKANNFKDGILGNATKREADAMVRTSLQQVSTEAKSAVFRENGDIIDGEQWISTLDSRTTEQCMSLDGLVFPVGEGPRPPIHIGCRSTMIPVLKKIEGLDLSQGLTRASADGPVDARQTYFDWLKGQSKDFQEDALGVTRAKLFRDGGLSSQEFARLQLDKNFEPMTLEEMREKEPTAFRRAGID